MLVLAGLCAAQLATGTQQALAFSQPSCSSTGLTTLYDYRTVLVDDTYSTASVDQVSDAVLQNDYFVSPDGSHSHLVGESGSGHSSVLLWSQPSHGSVTLNIDGTFSYTRSDNYFQGDSFQYVFRDNENLVCAGPATVTLTAIPSSLRTAEDTFTISQPFFANPFSTYHVDAPGVLANDTNPFGQVLIPVLDPGSEYHGSVRLNFDGSFDITPHGYQPAFTYHLCAVQDPRIGNGVAASCSNSSYVRVNFPRNRTIALPDAYQVPQSGLTVDPPGVTANDASLASTDWSDGSAHFQTSVASAPTHGTLAMGTTGGFTYTPDNGYGGPDSFTYNVCDVRGYGSFCSTNPVLVSLSVQPPPDTTAPTVTLTASPSNPSGGTPGSPVYVVADLGHGGSLHVVATAADNANGSGLSSGQCNDNGSPVAIVVFGGAMQLWVGQGTHNVTCDWSDLAGNHGSASATYRIDSVVGSVTIDPTPAATGGTDANRWYNAANLGGSFFYPNGPYIDVTVTATDPGDTTAITCGLYPGGQTVSGPGPTLDLPADFFGEGYEEASCTATDPNGNVSAPVVREFQVDTHAPSQTWEFHSASGGTPDQPWFNAADAGGNGLPFDVPVRACDICTRLDSGGLYLIERWSGPVSQTCTVDGIDPQSTASSPIVVQVRQGVHTLSCTATDAAGNTSAPISQQFRVDTVAPIVARVDAPTSTGAPLRVTFNEPVGADSVDSFRVRSASGAVLAVDPACAVAATADGLCATWTLTHGTPLVPGQTYTVRLGAAGAPVTDRAGNPLTPVTKSLRAPTVLGIGDPAVQQAWPVVPDRGAYGGSYIRESAAGASYSFSFAGTAITWFHRAGADQGKARVTVTNPGGTAVSAVVDSYASRASAHVATVFARLTDRSHTITVTALHSKRAVATGYWVSVDAMKVGGAAVVTTPAGVPRWATVTGGSPGPYAVSTQPGAALATSFRGTAVSMLLHRGPGAGAVVVSLDGATHRVDLYARRWSWSRVTLAGHLADGLHRLTVAVSPHSNSASSGRAVGISQVEIT